MVAMVPPHGRQEIVGWPGWGGGARRRWVSTAVGGGGGLGGRQGTARPIVYCGGGWQTRPMARGGWEAVERKADGGSGPSGGRKEGCEREIREWKKYRPSINDPMMKKLIDGEKSGTYI